MCMPQPYLLNVDGRYNHKGEKQQQRRPHHFLYMNARSGQSCDETLKFHTHAKPSKSVALYGKLFYLCIYISVLPEC